MKVFILVRHDPNEDIFGSIAVFKTLRVGFPTAEIVVDCQDLESYLELQKHIAEYFKDDTNIIIDCLWEPEEHYNWIQAKVQYNDGPIVFCDTDMIFYENVEDDLKIIYRDAELAGRYIPRYFNPTINAIEQSRLHTSLLYIPDAGKLRDTINSVRNTGLHPFNPFAPFQYFDHSTLQYYDCCANLFHLCSFRKFGELFLDKYTHLVSGTMLKSVAALLPGGSRLIEHHKMAKENPESVRGLWKEHDKFYEHYKI